MINQRIIHIILIAGLIISGLVASGIGAMPISPLQVIAILMDKAGLHLPVAYSTGMADVLLQIRLPRVCLGMLVGAGLAISGAALQGLFRNPLADPSLIGISAGASFFAVLTIVSFSAVTFVLDGSTLPGYYLLNGITFLGACFTSLLVFRLSRTGGRTLIATLLLAGLAINALCGAFTGLITYTANNEQLRSITFWSMGSLGAASWNTIIALSPFVVLPLVLLPRLSRSLNAFALGEAEAAYLGVNVKKLKQQVIVLTTLIVGACVAVSGIIGFVGLIVPHMLRTATGNDHRHLLADSALLGASLLTLADVLSRVIISPAELPIGIVTAILGTPLFILLLMKQKKYLPGIVS
jgi:iron complex transport system permease protein